jgi:hypothetical protein
MFEIFEFEFVFEFE